MSYCPSCGKEISEGAQFCPHCGVALSHNNGHSHTASGQGAVPLEMNLINAAKSVILEHYIDFNGRASKAEYWWFFLFNFLVGIAAMVIDKILSTDELFNALVTLALFLPGLAVFVRRMHDTGRSGWWILLSLTIIGIIPLIIWLVQDGDKNMNQYGSVPAL
ncbi:MAG TPA: DUF805 domain-containing protein [Sulfuricurvum sp.]|nr:DUF805 domain-containing protein [Sulfuricurvum sp.]